MKSEDLLYGPTTTAAVARQVNATATATASAVSGQRILVTGISITTNGNVVAAITATLADGATTIDQFEIPAGVPFQLLHNYSPRYLGAVNSAITLTVPACGASVACTAVLKYRVTGS